MSYDQKCWDLAKDFLWDAKPFTDQEVDELAQLIQTTIEEYLNHGRKKNESDH
jgi:hypothetical protein